MYEQRKTHGLEQRGSTANDRKRWTERDAVQLTTSFHVLLHKYVPFLNSQHATHRKQQVACASTTNALGRLFAPLGWF